MEFNIADELQNAAAAERSHTIYTEPSNMTIDMPDMVQVVRCKDCKHWDKYNDVIDVGCCLKTDCDTRENDYCSRGER